MNDNIFLQYLKTKSIRIIFFINTDVCYGRKFSPIPQCRV